MRSRDEGVIECPVSRVGPLSARSSSGLAAAGSSATGRQSEHCDSQPNSNLQTSEESQPRKSLRSAVLWLRRVREIGEKSAPAQGLALRRLSLIALCLTSLQACSLLSSRPPDPAPAVIKCPVVECLDRAMKVCEGVDPVPVRTCADAVLVASDALGEVVVCQESHAALIRCVEEFNRGHGR